MRIHQRVLEVTSLLFLLAPTQASIFSTKTLHRGDEINHSDAELAGYQEELLELSFEAASKFPLDPHIKNRSRAQERVADACFELEAPDRALRYVKGIANWRKALGYANYAAYFAERGEEELVDEYIELAVQLAELSEGWRKENVYSTIARIHIELGQRDKAAKYSEALEAGAAESVEASRAAKAQEEEEYVEHMVWIDHVFSAGNLDQVREGLVACQNLYRNFYGDEVRRAGLEEKVKTSIHKAPLVIGIDTILGMARIAIEHEDRDKGRQLALHVSGLIEGGKWLPEDEIPLVARTAEVQFLAGQPTTSVKALERMHTLYRTSRERIVDIYRADALVPLAEAYSVVGNHEKALELYALSIEEGMMNPNSRPRVDDLVATCCSMATHEVEPDSKFLERLRSITANLGDPW